MIGMIGGSKKNESSQFHINFISNLSPKKFMSMTKMEKRSFIIALRNAGDFLKHNIKEFIRCPSPKDKAQIKLEKFSINLEIGEVKKVIHLDGYIEFNKYCHLKFKEISDMFNSYMAPFDQRGIFNARYIRDYKKNTLDYTKKQGMKLV